MGTDLVIGESQQVSKVYVVEGLLSSSNWFLSVMHTQKIRSVRVIHTRMYVCWSRSATPDKVRVTGVACMYVRSPASSAEGMNPPYIPLICCLPAVSQLIGNRQRSGIRRPSLCLVKGDALLRERHVCWSRSATPNKE